MRPRDYSTFRSGGWRIEEWCQFQLLTKLNLKLKLSSAISNVWLWEEEVSKDRLLGSNGQHCTLDQQLFLLRRIFSDLVATILIFAAKCRVNHLIKFKNYIDQQQIKFWPIWISQIGPTVQKLCLFYPCRLVYEESKFNIRFDHISYQLIIKF